MLNEVKIMALLARCCIQSMLIHTMTSLVDILSFVYISIYFLNIFCSHNRSNWMYKHDTWLIKDLKHIRGSVSETMRKALIHRSPNCIKITRRTFCGMRVFVPLVKFCDKHCFLMQNFSEIGQLAAGLWPKNNFWYGGHPTSFFLSFFLSVRGRQQKLASAEASKRAKCTSQDNIHLT